MIHIKINGLEQVIGKFNKADANIKKNIQQAFKDCGNRISADAKQLVSANASDTGYLQNSIHPVYRKMGTSIVASAKYAAYIEFGTRKFAATYVASLPSDWAAYANTFRGKSNSGDFYDFLNAILDWVKRKGIAHRYSVKTRQKMRMGKKDNERLEQTAENIAKSILINGIAPRPFMYPSVNKNLPILLQDIKNALKL